jgi:hypothetical protein
MRNGNSVQSFVMLPVGPTRRLEQAGFNSRVSTIHIALMPTQTRCTDRSALVVRNIEP